MNMIMVRALASNAKNNEDAFGMGRFRFWV